MTKFDRTYKTICEQILNLGEIQKDGNVRAKYASDKSPAKTVYKHGISFEIDPDEVAILTSKQVPQRDPLTEIEWIWQEMSNDVRWLQERKCKVWNNWEKADHTIGKAYGWQLRNKKRKAYGSSLWGTRIAKEVNQVEYVINELLHNPTSRRIMTSLWCFEDLDEMALEPCVYGTHWEVDEESRLVLHVKQRSADICLGLPYNVYQYQTLQRLMAKVVGLELGPIYWNIDNAHIYLRHIPALMDQLANPTFAAPEIEIHVNPDPELTAAEQFFTSRLSHCVKLTGYEHSGRVPYEIAE